MGRPQNSCLSLKLLHDAISAAVQNASQAFHSQSRLGATNGTAHYEAAADVVVTQSWMLRYPIAYG